MILRAGSVPGTEAQSGYPDPFNLGRGFLSYLNFGDAGGLTQFGVALETLLPGKQSSQMHWHEKEDEFLYLLSGALTVVEDGKETALQPGDACCWKAGDGTAHCLRNHSDEPATYLIVGTRAEDDICHYPDLDLLATPQGFTHLDGTPYPKKGETK
ncbi:transcriptional regulator [Sulfitobacter porphyrae]|nr:transcriptional regulator [Sulfitobacter porphyrae]